MGETSDQSGRLDGKARRHGDMVGVRVERQLRAYTERRKAFGRGVERGELAERAPAEIGPRSPRFGRSAKERSGDAR